MRRTRLLIGALGLRALALLLLAAGPSAFAATGTVNLSTPPQQTKRERRPSPTIESLPAPAVSGPLRVLLVDDDVSDNNHQPGDARESPSDTVFRRLAADAVGGDAESWSIETVKPYANGPSLDRLRRFSLILWYTGSSYGGNPDNSAVLSLEDEKTVRRYLEEVGGVVVLFSPGYLDKILDRASSWEDSSWPFLAEVLGIRGGLGLAQRFLPGTVTATRAAQFQVGKGGTVESQFSLVNPDGAAVLFTATLSAAKGGGLPAPVATAFAYGRGRIIYVGFTFENLEAAALAPAFQEILAATGLTTGQPTAPSTVAATQPSRTIAPINPSQRKGEVIKSTSTQPPAPPPRPPPPPPLPPPPPTTSPDSQGDTSTFYLTAVRVNIYTGNDNKELLSRVQCLLNRPDGSRYAMSSEPGAGQAALYSYLESDRNAREFKVNSNTEFVLDTPYRIGYEVGGSGMTYRPDEIMLELIQRWGLTLGIGYFPNFFADAWKIEKVTITLEFKDARGRIHPTLSSKTIIFNNASKLMTDSNQGLIFKLDGNLVQQN